MVLLMFVVSCTGDEGPPGPAGPAGQQGPAGPQGGGAGAQPTATPAPTATPPPEPAGRYGGTLLVMHPADPPSFDTVSISSSSVAVPVSPTYNQIVQYDPLDGEQVIGDLAQSWELSGDGRTYTFKFHKGIVWHDGRTFTAADAKAGLELSMEGASLRGRALAGIEKIEATDTETLQITLESPFSLVHALAWGTVLIPAKHAVDQGVDLKTAIVGTGPFKLEKYTRGSSIEYTKNPDYFISGRPYLDGLTTLIVKDEAARLAAMQTGRVHLTSNITGFSKLQVDQLLRSNPEINTGPFAWNCSWRVALNTAVAPWDNIKVRQAVNLAIDRQGAINALGQGVGIPSVAPLYGSFALPLDELVTLPGYRQPKDDDIAEAKRLLSEAGFPNGIDDTYTMRADFPPQPKWGEIVQAQLAKAGIRLNVDGVDSGEFVKRLYREVTYGIAGDSGCQLFPHPGGLRPQLGDGSGLWGKADPVLLDIFKDIESSLDPAVQQQLAFDFQRTWLERLPSVFAFGTETFLAWAPQVQNYKPGVGLYGNLRRQDVWLAR